MRVAAARVALGADVHDFEQGAQAIEQAMQHCIAQRQVTRDIGGTLGTRATGAALIKALEQV